MSRLLKLAAAAALSLCFVPASYAQDAAPQTTVEQGQVYPDSLGSEDTHAYTLELPADYFVVGSVDQISVDVVVTVLDGEGEEVRTFDSPARGPEMFQLTTEKAGVYRFEVSPFEEETGLYEFELRLVEPGATTPEGKVDQLMSAYSGEETPGAVAAIVRDGEVEFARAYGMANLTHGIPMTVDTRNNIGSTSKQFTAFAILLLAQQGELTLDDDIRIHIEELPDLGETVTIRNLLTHTSGYREFLNALSVSGRRLDEGDFIAREEIIALVQNQPELQNSPGAEWNYNNTAFALLTVVASHTAISGTLPRLNYPTSADMLLIVCYFLATAVTVVSIAVNRMKVGGSAERAERIDRRARWMLPAVAAVVLGVSVLVLWI